MKERKTPEEMLKDCEAIKDTMYLLINLLQFPNNWTKEEGEKLMQTAENILNETNYE